MCWYCENPSDTDAGVDGLRVCVRAHGWVIKYVEDDRRPYAYTIGLHQLGLPELLVTGVTSDRALALLDYFIEEVIADGAPKPGDLIVLCDNAMIEAVTSTIRMLTWISRSSCSDPHCAHYNSYGLTPVGVGPGTKDSTSTACANRCSGCGLRTRSGGTAPCNAVRARRTSPWPSAGRASSRRGRFRSRTVTATPTSAARAPPR